MDLQTRVDILEQKVRDLERQLFAMQNTQNTQNIQKQNIQKIQHNKPTSASTSLSTAPSPAQQPSEPSRDFEQLLAKVWLPRIFIMVFLIGVIWAFAAAVNAGIITESIRCILGFVGACIMFWLGERQIRLKRHVLGQVLSGGAIALLMISLFASHMLYGFIPHGLAFILYVISIGLGVFVAIRHRSQTLVIITMIAGYLVPFLVNSPSQSVWLFVIYESLFSIAMLLLSIHYRYIVALVIAIGLLHLPLLIGLFNGNWNNYETPFMAAITLQHAVLLTVSIIRSQRFGINQPFTLLASFMLLAGWMYALYGRVEITNSPLVLGHYPIILLLWSLVYSVIAFWNTRQGRSELNVHMSIATLGWLLWLVHIVNADYLPSALLIHGALALFLGFKLKSLLQQITGTCSYLIGVLMVLVNSIPHFFSAQTLEWVIMLSSLGGLYITAHKTQAEAKYLRIRNMLGWIIAIFLLIFITKITNIFTRIISLDLQHLILSAVWIVYAIGIIIFGFVTNVRKARLAGVSFLLFILLKIIFIDLPDVSIAVRAVLFIGLGGIGLVVSRLFYKTKK